MKYILFPVILASVVDFTSCSPTGCSCYNPLVGGAQEYFGDPKYACGNSDRCFVRCDGSCSDMTILSAGLFDGKCQSESACSAGSSPALGETSSSCYCGLTLDGKQLEWIVGGTEADKHEYPWQVGFVDKGETAIWCGGSLISDSWVLTAAHCPQAAYGHGAESIQVLLGLHDTSKLDPTKTIRSDVVRVVTHPDYRKGTRHNYDFALIKLATSVDFVQYRNIRPICLPEDTSKDFVGEYATVSGWGNVEEGGENSNVLQEVEVKVISDESCKNDYAYKESDITDQMVCANMEGGGQDSCQNDSGGPLVSAGSGDGFTPGQNYELVGVVSWGNGCARADYPGVYARVSKQLTWIAGVTAQGWSTCPRA